MRNMELALKQLCTEGGTQPRVAINEETVAEYADLLKEGTEFPAVVAFYDTEVYWLADGFHRYHAHVRAGLKKIEVDVRDGSLRDAILYAVGANTEHGLRRTNEDKRKAVTTMLTHDLAKTGSDGHPWSDREIAKMCRVSAMTVNRIRRELSVTKLQIAPGADSATSESGSHADAKRLVKRGKSTYVQNTANINRNRTPQPSGPAPAAKVRFKPCKFHAEDGPVPMRIINLPLNNPDQAALSLISVYGEEYVRKVNAKLNQIFKNERTA